MNAYFQFAGYSDIAIGLALLMGYRIMENFNYPFLSKQYAGVLVEVPYVPLSFLQGLYLYADCCLLQKTVAWYLDTMIIIGLWHEISLPFVIWGLLQATGIYVAFLLRDRPSSVFTRNLGRLFVLNLFYAHVRSY